MITHSTRIFSWDKATRTMSVDISTLGPTPFGRAYDDAADEGFQLVSHLTGAVAMFAVTGHVYSKGPDRELLAWVLKPTAAALRAQPTLRGLTVKVFNT